MENCTRPNQYKELQWLNSGGVNYVSVSGTSFSAHLDPIRYAFAIIVKVIVWAGRSGRTDASTICRVGSCRN